MGRPRSFGAIIKGGIRVYGRQMSERKHFHRAIYTFLVETVVSVERQRGESGSTLDRCYGVYRDYIAKMNEEDKFLGYLLSAMFDDVDVLLRVLDLVWGMHRRALTVVESEGDEPNAARVQERVIAEVLKEYTFAYDEFDHMFASCGGKVGMTDEELSDEELDAFVSSFN